MYLAPTDDERQIIDATAQALAAEAPLETWFRPEIKAAVEEDRILKLSTELGWAGLAAPASIGGSEATVVEELLSFREFGRKLGPVGLTAAAIGALVAFKAGDLTLAKAIIAGEVKIGLVVDEGRVLLGGAGGGYGLSLTGGEFRLLQFDASLEATKSLDWTTTAYRLGAEHKIVARVEDETLALRFALIIAAQQQAISEAALLESVAYAKLREQFGRPIGSFQAIRHKCVDMAVRAERAKAQLFFAAVALRDQRDDAPFQILAASFLSQEAARSNAEINIFIHGAMGVTTENAGHLFLKRSILWAYVVESTASILNALANAPPPQI